MRLVVEKYFYVLLVFLLVGFAYSRIVLWDQEGGDQSTYKDAVEMFDQGQNPYTYTVAFFENEKLEHGYAYLPSLLYIQHFFYILNRAFNLDMPLRHLWKIPVVIADLGVALIIFLKFYKKYKLFTLFTLAFWFFNPYFTARNEYTLYDPLPVLFLLLSLFLLGTKDFLSGLLFALSLSFKTFGLILLPLYLFKSKSFLKVLGGGLVFAILISIPFMRSVSDFQNYIQGSLLVHGERGIQGRPFISFLSYTFALPFIQIVQNGIFTALAVFLPWLTILINKKKDPFILALFAFTAYYLITPVLNRTHIIWGIPFMLVGGYFFSTKKEKSPAKFYLTAVFLYFVIFAYLYVWNKGLDVLWINSKDFIVSF